MTPIDADRLKQLFRESHLKQTEATFLVNGFRQDFDINYRGPTNQRYEVNNIPFKVGNKYLMWKKIMTEVKEGRYAGPYEMPPYPNYIQSLIGLVPNGKNKVRLIFHLSFEFTEGSVNYHIPDELCSVKYNDLDKAVRLTLMLNRKPVVYGKTDMSNAFRLVPL